MKKLFFVFALILLLAACGGESEREKQVALDRDGDGSTETADEDNGAEEFDENDRDGDGKTNSAEEEISTKVELESNAEIDGNSIVIEGETNLPDDTLIAYEVTHEEDFEYFVDGEMKVSDGIYTEEIDVNDWPEGELRVWTSFQTILGTSVEQPEEIIEVFGESGENIEGDNVTEGEIINSVESIQTLNKN
ncbi:hypothetical protein [Oceanobacillus sp. FSL K6-0251]|uniref:hypothetical protein n=1 Tax=Oceanobacillus sp. FSL K6-0251 TaxID=2921602 RepID=UPI0030F54ED1